MGGDRQRHRVPRRVPALLRHVPHVQRLHARRRPARGPVRAARDLRLDPRLGRASARTGRPTSRSSTTRPCARSPTCGSSGPGDANEASAAWALAVERHGDRRRAVRAGRARADPPEAADPARARRSSPARACAAAGTSCARPGEAARPQLILIGTGSELQLAFRAADALEADGIPTRVVSAAVLGAVRGAGPGVPRQRCCRRRCRSACRVEIGRLAGLGALRRRRGRDHRARPLRRERPGRDDLQGVRLHGRPRGGRRPAGGPRGPPRPVRRSAAARRAPTLGPATRGRTHAVSDPGHD